MADLFGVPYFGFKVAGVHRYSAVTGVADGGPREHCEIIYKLSGRSVQTIQGKTFEFLPCDVLLIPKGAGNHAVITEDGETILAFFDIVGEQGEFDFEHFRFPPHNAVKNLFEKLLRAESSASRSSKFERDAVMCEIFAELVKEKEKQYFSSERFTRISPAVDYIRAHFRERIHIEQLAAMCSLSQTYLRQLFAHYFGQSPLELIIGMRLEFAHSMLCAGSVTVEETAAASGFDNLGYFSRAYKKRYGVTPGYTLKNTVRHAYL